MSAVSVHLHSAPCHNVARVYRRRRTARGRVRTGTVPGPDPTLPAATRRRASLHWARLLARIYAIQPLSCPRCQGPMRLIAFLTEPTSIRALLAHLGEPTTPPPLAPRARAPPELETEGAGMPEFTFDQSLPWDPTTSAPDPGYPFDQTLN